jgi:anti-sigma-K factor RskA
MSHDEIVELLGAYALDALEPDEAALLRGHLEECHRCVNEVAEHHALAGMLGNSGQDAPAHLWDRIASEIERPDDADKVRPVTLLFSDQSADDRLPRRGVVNSRFFRTVAILTAAAGIVVIAAMGIQIGRLNDRVGRVQDAATQQSMTQTADSAVANVNANVVKLTAASTGGPTVAEVVVLPNGDAYMINDRLGSLPSDKTYQLWGRVGDQVVSLGLLGSNPEAVPFRVNPTAKVQAYAITEEVAGGVVRSTQVPVAVGALT